MFNVYSPVNLAGWCLAIKHGHGAGLPLTKVFDNLARSGPKTLRPSARDISAALKRGTSLDDAFKRFLPNAPRLLTAMTVVAEQSGHIPEVFGHLERYFREQEKLEREFKARATWPMIQLCFAIVIMAGLIFVLGILGPAATTLFGNGPTRLVIGFVLVLGLIIGGFVLFKRLRGALESSATIGNTLMRIPTVSRCLLSLAMSRFCLALQLTTDSSMRVEQAVSLSLEATGLAVFSEQTPRILSMIESGEDLSTALGHNPVFPNQFLGVISVAEVSGQIPEVMARQAEHYREETSRTMASLTKQLNIGLAVIVAMAMIAAIFSLASVYVNALNG